MSGALSHPSSPSASDAFGQKFGRTPTAVNGFSNLFCMELDPNVDSDEAPVGLPGSGAGGAMPSASTAVAAFMREYGGAIPGIDELMSFAELMRHVQQLEYDVTVFDTAPTGHTLRLLSLPGLIEKALSKVLGMSAQFGPMLSMAGGLAPGMLPSEAEIVGVRDARNGWPRAGEAPASSGRCGGGVRCGVG